ncbi:hypothetical protein B0T26DRAFT_671823 [Lasiosphaeria miniovina]|uniref:Uncharacterized protein n=1 Tax=Lasiosphaeria miniovina TaxID=1954250 RepID=A0AA40B3P6_9PEZI|nr:uncharacterized protein B0T26DRAFT_671823 [Lasiosphaeria miniovina]KAK0727105.1 hypothetical protein B0T26DRAFT_671823 [Lasiosphaeria miniovina]
MTEPETFDDELFADLYNDDEPSSAKPASAPAQDQYSAAPAAAENRQYEMTVDTNQYQERNNGGDSHWNNEQGEDDDDDDVDFNLGDGPVVAPAAGAHHHQDDSKQNFFHNSPAAAAPVKGPNSKEDGYMLPPLDTPTVREDSWAEHWRWTR